MRSRLATFNQRVAAVCGLLASPLLLIVRLFWGYYYWRSGVTKLMSLSHLVEYFRGLELPLPGVCATLTAITHLICGVAMMVGFLGRTTAIPLAITMIVAYATVHHEAMAAIFRQPAVFLQALPFLFLFSNLLVIAFGPGALSIDAWLARGENKNY